MNPSARNEQYLAHPDPWGTTPAATVVAEVASAMEAGLGAGAAVDLGCGDGRHSRWLAGLGWRVDAIDVDEDVIASARDRDSDDGRAGHVDWIAADALSWSPSAAVDLVVIGFVHLPLERLRQVIARAAGWLALGGHLLFVGHAAENLQRGVGGPKDPSTLPTIEDLAAGAAGLRVLSLRHELRPAGTATAVDAVLHATTWD